MGEDQSYGCKYCVVKVPTTTTTSSSFTFAPTYIILVDL